MYGTADYEVLRQPHEEIQREGAIDHPKRIARENRGTKPYVVRDLSWELALFLDTEDFQAIATLDGANGNTPQPE
jgi:hypothetical protein